jgi:hypothetical protein
MAAIANPAWHAAVVTGITYLQNCRFDGIWHDPPAVGGCNGFSLERIGTTLAWRHPLPACWLHLPVAYALAGLAAGAPCSGLAYCRRWGWQLGAGAAGLDSEQAVFGIAIFEQMADAMSTVRCSPA